MKSKLTHWIVTEPVYTSIVHVFVGCKEDFVNWQVENGYQPTTPNGSAVCVHLRRITFALWFEDDLLPDSFGLMRIVHESSHVARAIMRIIRIPVSLNNDEAFTYYLAWLVNAIWIKVNKQGRR